MASSGARGGDPYPEASSKTETDLKSDVIPLQFQIPKRINVFELLLGHWRIMTSSRGLPARSGTIKITYTERRILKLKLN